MLEHFKVDLPGLYIVVDCPWHGIGALIGSAVSWLSSGQPSYVYASNHLYHPRGNDPCNKWDWFFNQSLLDIPYNIKIGRDESKFSFNAGLNSKIVDHYRYLINNQWSIKEDLIVEAKSFLPGGRTLGVHYRGTDKVTEIPRPSINLVADYITNLISERDLDNVLIATDDDRALISLRSKLDFPVFWFKPHIRGDIDIGIHHYKGSYRQARETMIEILAIGMCEHMLIGRSSVSEAMLFLGNCDFTYYN